jgi:hypothetical protein
MANQAQIDAFVDYMKMEFPPPATILANPAPGGSRYDVSVSESGVEMFVSASFEFLTDLHVSDISHHLRTWKVAEIVRKAGKTQRVMVRRDRVILMPR